MLILQREQMQKKLDRDHTSNQVRVRACVRACTHVPFPRGIIISDFPFKEQIRNIAISKQ